ncbi:hypothetical protein CPB83DRAFT_901340 [Crepidotus variabilis]|uniref:Homeobox domain-containing protein n=1 Tax=Crepidotus variabilis TaxID=179855 RepID=A0A9P6JWH0_9AGAR|nr:hypothetical protein CPB83DRAFT_901340 [Crepidotus variabilis]
MNTANREALLNILSAARKTKALVSSYRGPQKSSPSGTHKATYTIPSLKLPYPDDLADTIRSKSLPLDVGSEISAKIQRCIVDTQRLHTSNFQATCTKLLEETPTTASHTLFTKLAAEYERSYQTNYIAWIRSMLSQYLSRFPENDNSERRKPLFNAAYTPVLEKYFQTNAYPSALERRILAKKSRMTARQIEVWFQNHRNRSKKDGILLQRPHFGRLPICLDDLEREALGINSSPLTEDESSDDEQTVIDSSFIEPVDNFTSSAPQHAFPTQYPPHCNYDPFPMGASPSIFPFPQWPRKPQSSSANKSPVDVEELATLFASKLSLRENISRTIKEKTMTPTNNLPWFCATVTLPPSAPHPALVQPTPDSCALNPRTRRFSPFPSTTKAFIPRRSHKPRLPSRLPNWSRSSPPSKSRLSARTASLESISSYDSSSSSSSLDELATPPLTPLQTPGLIFNDLFENTLSFDFPDFSPSTMSLGLDASTKLHGGFAPIFSSFQYATSS